MKTTLPVLVAVLALLGGIPGARAQMTWDASPGIAGIQDGSGAWDTTTANWYSGGSDAAWGSGAAVFGSAFNAGTAGISLGTVTAAGGVSASGVTFQSNGSYTVAGTLALSGATPTIDISSTGGATQTVSAQLSGTGALTLTNSGGNAASLLVLSGSNTGYSGTTSVSGRLQLGNGNALGTGVSTIQQAGRLEATAALTVANDLVFTGNQTGTSVLYSGIYNAAAGYNGVMALSGDNTSSTYSGHITLDRGTSTGTGELRFQQYVSGANQTVTLSGGVSTTGGTTGSESLDFNVKQATSAVNVTGSIVGAGSTNAPAVGILVEGAGTLRLSGTGSSYIGTTTAYGTSTLLVNNATGSGTGRSGIVINSGTTLGGTGFMIPQFANGLTVSSGGRVAPGDGGIGTLTLNLGSSTGKAAFATGSTFLFDLGVPGGSDVLAFTGSSAGDVTFNGNTINFNNVGGLAAGTYTLFTFDAAGAYSGTLTLGAGLGAFAGSLVYNPTSIQLTVAPEPPVAAFLGLGFAFAGGLALRRPFRAAVFRRFAS